jgi:hypothetical protein
VTTIAEYLERFYGPGPNSERVGDETRSERFERIEAIRQIEVRRIERAFRRELTGCGADCDLPSKSLAERPSEEPDPDRLELFAIPAALPRFAAGPAVVRCSEFYDDRGRLIAWDDVEGFGCGAWGDD